MTQLWDRSREEGVGCAMGDRRMSITEINVSNHFAGGSEILADRGTGAEQLNACIKGKTWGGGPRLTSPPARRFAGGRGVPGQYMGRLGWPALRNKGKRVSLSAGKNHDMGDSVPPSNT